MAEFTAWWNSRGRSELHDLLMTEWDPIGVADVPEAYDEYDSCLEPVAGILRSGGNTADIAEYLANVESRMMGLGGQADQLIDVATKIVAWYSAAAATQHRGDRPQLQGD